MSSPTVTTESFLEALRPEIVGGNCALTKPPATQAKAFSIKSEFIAYASPESTYAVTARLLNGAEKSIRIGIYDFTAKYVKELLFKAMRRGVKVTLMLDLDGRAGEQPVFDDLARHGATCVPAPSCASKRAHYYPYCHEKFIIVDDTWVFVQSGNWSEASIPFNEVDGGDRARFDFGNRDMGIAIKSPDLAKFFGRVLARDIKLETGATTPQALEDTTPGFAELEAFGAKPKAPAPTLFPSKSFKPTTAVKVLPILSPDNYVKEIIPMLRAATTSIDIEQQYIRREQAGVKDLLAAIKAARQDHPQLKVRVVLARPINKADGPKIADLAQDGLKLGTHVRLLAAKHFAHCHNKLVIVDRKRVLISSQNWSTSAVTKNREAGLLLDYPALAAHYASIFDVDWQTGEKQLPKAKPPIAGPESLASGKTLRLNWGDYAEV
jgi:phosphatidylserine/phosphatidylglycerophosphate/cardiolipin synthase-like enzyme